MAVSPAERQRRVEAIATHSRFGEARSASIDGYLAVYSWQPVLNKLLVEGARHVIVTFVMCLDAAQREDDPQSWLTLGKLQETVAAHKVGSAGLVEALVKRMLDCGLLSSSPAPLDRRKRILAPTAALIAHDLDLLEAQARPCAILLASQAMELALARDVRFQRAARLVSVRSFAEAMQLLAEHREIMMFISRDSGYLALLAVLSNALTSGDRAISRVAYQEIAGRFGVSRTHVRELFDAAESAGLVRLLSEGGTEIEIRPALWRCFDGFLAACMELFDRDCTDAVSEMDSARRG